MQDFDEAFLLPTGGRLAMPTGRGAEAFVHADDIADVAVATLVAPVDHDGAGYTLTGPEALTLADVADRQRHHRRRRAGHRASGPQLRRPRLVADSPRHLGRGALNGRRARRPLRRRLADRLGGEGAR